MTLVHNSENSSTVEIVGDDSGERNAVDGDFVETQSYVLNKQNICMSQMIETVGERFRLENFKH